MGLLGQVQQEAKGKTKDAELAKAMFEGTKEYRKKLGMMNEYMKYAQVPKSLRDHLRIYYELWCRSRSATLP